MLNAVAGLQDISDGEIWISDKNVTWDEPKDRGIGMVFQPESCRKPAAQRICFGPPLLTAPVTLTGINGVVGS